MYVVSAFRRTSEVRLKPDTTPTALRTTTLARTTKQRLAFDAVSTDNLREKHLGHSRLTIPCWMEPVHPDEVPICKEVRIEVDHRRDVELVRDRIDAAIQLNHEFGFVRTAGHVWRKYRQNVGDDHIGLAVACN